MRRAAAAILIAAGLSACVTAPPPGAEIGGWDGPCGVVEPAPIEIEDNIPACHHRAPPSALVIHPVQAASLPGLRSRNHEEPIWRPLAGDMVQVIGTSAPGGFSFPDRSLLPRLTDAAMWRQAEANLDKAAETAEIRQQAPGLLFVDTQWVDRNSLVFSRRFWKRAEFARFKGEPLVGFGMRNDLEVADSADAEGVARLRRSMDSAADFHERADTERAKAGRRPLDYPEFHSAARDLFLRHADGSWTAVAPQARAALAP